MCLHVGIHETKLAAHGSNTPVVPVGGLCVQRGLTCLLVLLAAEFRHHILPNGGSVTSRKNGGMKHKAKEDFTMSLTYPNG